MKFTKIVLTSFLLTATFPPSFLSQESNLLKPIVPAMELERAKKIKPAVDLRSPEIIEKGNRIFHGKGECYLCHGNNGKGDGIAAVGLDPSPRNFTNPKFKLARTPGEMFWVLKHGSPGRAMMSAIPGLISEEEGWAVIAYERSLGGD